jgi:hypothetical protein
MKFKLDKPNIFYDIETYPSYFFLMYKFEDDDKIYKITTPKEVKEFFEQDANIWGFYSHGFDDIVCDYIINLDLKKPQQIKEYADLVINGEADLTFSRFQNSFDVMKYRDNNTMFNLKSFESAIGVDIEETPVAFDKEILTQEEINLVEKYCEHDVKCTELFYKKLKEVGRINASLELANMIAEETNDTAQSLFRRSTNGMILRYTKNYNTKYDSTNLRKYLDSCKLEYIHEIPEEIQDWLFSGGYSTTKPKETSFNNWELGLGGVHFLDPEYEKRKLINLTDADVSSLYPNLMLNLNSLGEFTPKFREIIQSRITDKKAGNINMANAKKLLCNSIYGISRSRDFGAHLFNSWLGLGVCIAGQFILYNLAQKINNETSCKVISANTDSVTWTYSTQEENKKAKILVEEYSRQVNLEFDFDNMKMFQYKDVNNYIAIKDNGKIKRKGVFAQKFFSNGYIIPKVVEDILVNNLSLDRSLDLLKSYSQSNPEYFTLRAKTRSDWDIFKVDISYKPRYSVKTGKELKHPEEVIQELQNVGHQLRVYSCLNGSTYRKLNANTGSYSKVTGIPDNVSNEFSLDNLDLSYYNKEVAKLYEAMTKGEQNNGN